MHQGKILHPDLLLLNLQLLPQGGQRTVVQLAGLCIVPLSLGDLDLAVHGINLLPELRELLHGSLFILPLSLPVVKFILQLSKLFLQCFQPLLAQSVALFLECDLLDFQLHGPAVQLIQLRGHGIQLRFDQGTGLVHQIDGLIRKKAVRDIAVREHCGTDQGIVHDLHAVINLIALL